MDVLRNLFGNLTSGLIRLGVTVGIIAAIGFFLVKPALDTTNKAIDSANRYQKTFDDSFDTSDINRSIKRANHQVQVQVQRAFHQSRKQGDADKLIRCIQRAHQDVGKIQRCSVRFQ